jgi:hypothetical protein
MEEELVNVVHKIPNRVISSVLNLLAAFWKNKILSETNNIYEDSSAL